MKSINVIKYKAHEIVITPNFYTVYYWNSTSYGKYLDKMRFDDIADAKEFINKLESEE